MLNELTQAWGVSGREKKIRAIIRREIEGLVDELYTDNLGNLIVLKKGISSPKKKEIMLGAHMDEIGLPVKKIEGNGRIRVYKVGWVWTAALYNDKIIFQNGVIGVVGYDSDIEQAKNDVGKLYIDIGCTSKEETEKYVQVGDYCGFIGHFYELQNDHICSKSFDVRIGCYLLIEALKRNKGQSPNDIYCVFSVQEEVGCRGAQPLPNRSDRIWVFPST